MLWGSCGLSRSTSVLTAGIPLLGVGFLPSGLGVRFRGGDDSSEIWVGLTGWAPRTGQRFEAF